LGLSRIGRLAEKIEELRTAGLKGISFYLTAGYPSMTDFMSVLKLIKEKKLADFVEIGLPFSDPLADGPVIQRASGEAIKAGATFQKITRELGRSGIGNELPLVAMTYINIMLAGGLEKRIEDAAEAGFSAFIIPDLSYEESGEFSRIASKYGMGTVLLASPSTPIERVRLLSENSTPFLYYVSRYGVTGCGIDIPENIGKRLKNVRETSVKPVYCGFGISNEVQAKVVAEHADGIIIGSALVKLMGGKKYFKEAEKFAISINQVLSRI